jgi:hypothetical protein
LPAVRGRGEAAHRLEAKRHHHPERAGVEARHGDTEGFRRELLPPELKPGRDRGTPAPAPGQRGPQAAAGVER